MYMIEKAVLWTGSTDYLKIWKDPNKPIRLRVGRTLGVKL